MQVSDKVLLGLSILVGATLAVQSPSQTESPQSEGQKKTPGFQSFYFGKESISENPKNETPILIDGTELEVPAEDPGTFFPHGDPCLACGMG